MKAKTLSVSMTDGFTFRIVAKDFDLKTNDVNMLIMIGAQRIRDEFNVFTDLGVTYTNGMLNFLTNAFDEDADPELVKEIFRKGDPDTTIEAFLSEADRIAEKERKEKERIKKIRRLH